MRQIIINLCFLLLIILFYGRNQIYAQVSPAITPSIPFMSAPVDCGIEGGPNEKCCTSPLVNNDDLIKSKRGIPGTDQMVDAINAAFKQIVKPITDPLNNIAQKTMQPCYSGQPSTPGNPNDPNCKCIKPTVAPLVAISKLCNGVSAKENGACLSCVQQSGVYTGLGCISSNFSSFVQDILVVKGIGLAGMFALLCIIYAAFTLQTSRGNPEKIKKAQELLTSCIMGLMLIIFSVFILRLIGVDILKIPGFK